MITLILFILYVLFGYLFMDWRLRVKGVKWSDIWTDYEIRMEIVRAEQESGMNLDWLIGVALVVVLLLWPLVIIRKPK